MNTDNRGIGNIRLHTYSKKQTLLRVGQLQGGLLQAVGLNALDHWAQVGKLVDRSLKTAAAFPTRPLQNSQYQRNPQLDLAQSICNAEKLTTRVALGCSPESNMYEEV